MRQEELWAMKVEPVDRLDPATCGVDDAIADHLRE